jgi:hypothetical protein
MANDCSIKIRYLLRIGILNSIVFLFFAIVVGMQKGISEVVSFVLVLAIMVTSTMAAYVWANSSIPALNEPGRVKNLANQMLALDSAIKSVAHGDINFTTKFELYYPDAYFEMRNTTGAIDSNLMAALIFRQNAVILGYTNVVVSGCTDSYVNDAATRTTMYRYTTMDNVYVGAQANGPGQAEISICYTSINLTSHGGCQRGRTGPYAILNIQKEGVSGSMPQVSITVC